MARLASCRDPTQQLQLVCDISCGSAAAGRLGWHAVVMPDSQPTAVDGVWSVRLSVGSEDRHRQYRCMDQAGSELEAASG